MKTIKFLLIILFNIAVIEFFCFIFILLSIVPNGISIMTSGISNKDYSIVHIPNRNYNFAYECWESNVFYNENGNRKYSDNPKAIKIALLGDSMTENAQLSDGYDMGSLLQMKLGNKYEVTNYGVFSTGIYDHLQKYKNEISKKYDLLIYFPDTTDITDNHVSRNRPNQNMFKVQNDKIIKIPYDEEYWKKYFSKYNEFKRNYLFYVKKYSSTYKVYWTLKERWNYYKQEKNLQKSSQQELIDRLADPIKVYEYISEKFIDELKKDNQKFMIVLTLKPSKFLKDDFNDFKYDFLKKTWGQNNFYDPYSDAVRYMEDKGIFKFPFLSWTCDSHYSHAGADFYSTYLSSIID